MASTVHVENISVKTSEDEIKSFFSFCGKIQSISVKPTGNDAQSASVTFEKAAAAKTALLLDNTQLGPNSVQVSAAKSLDEIASEKAGAADTTRDEDHIEQEQKPRARIFAEYLAHGYVISDKAIEKALAADKQHGVSTKFTNALQTFDNKTQATQKAQAVDNKLGITKTAYAGWASLTSYFDKAQNTPTGQKLRTFYDQGNKTVLDVHNEARHLANLKKGQSGESSTQAAGANSGYHHLPPPSADKTVCSCQADSGNCACSETTCACSGCGKNDMPSAEAMNVHSLPPPNASLTQCDCAAEAGKCPCPEGKCACVGCAKAKDAGNDKIAL